MRQTFFLLAALVFLASCGTASTVTSTNIRPLPKGGIPDDIRFLRGSSAKTHDDDDEERGGFFSGLFKAKTITDPIETEHVKTTLALFEGMKGKTGTELDEAIEAAAKSTNANANKFEAWIRGFQYVRV